MSSTAEQALDLVAAYRKAQLKIVIGNLPEWQIQEGEGGQCAVCLKEYEKDEIIKFMPCNHFFHILCLLTWLNMKESCPYCKQELKLDD